MSEIVISAEKRDLLGKSESRRIRHKGLVPGTIYGEKSEPVNITLSALELSRLLRKDHALVNVQVAGKDQQTVIKEVQRHPVSGDVVHIDFQRIASGHAIKVTVPLHFTGSAAGVKSGGVFSAPMHELEISVLPRFLPEHLELDINQLEFGDSIRVKDLNFENIDILEDEQSVVCQVVAPRKVVEEVESEILTEEEEESAEPEVITARADKEEEE